MHKKILALTSLLLLMLTINVPMVLAHNEPFPGTYNPYVVVIDLTGTPESFDPAWHYDTTSAAVIMNVYETLIGFLPVWDIGPYQPDTGPQRISEFEPVLASALPTIEKFDPPLTNPKGGLPIYSRFTFPVRTGVPFHSGGTMTARDVEYSIERALVSDRAGGPVWLLYEMLMGAYGAEAPGDDPNWGIKIDGTVEQDGTNVWFNLGMEYPDMAVQQILAQTWGSVMSEEWAVAEGDLNMAEVSGGWANWEYIYNKWNNPRPSELEDAVDNPDTTQRSGGTGPYRISYKTATAWSIKAFEDHDSDPATLPTTYWRGWPHTVPEANSPVDKLPDYVNEVVWNLIPTWSTRLARFIAGDTDFTAVPRLYRAQVLGQGVGGELIRCMWPVTSLSGFGIYYTHQLSTASAHVPEFYPDGTFGTNGLPADAFTDLNMRKAFSHSLDFDWWLASAYLGEAVQPADPIVEGLAYNNADQSKPDFSLTKTEYYLKLAWGGVDARSGVPGVPVLPEDPTEVTPGDLWDGGMKFEAIWPTGAVVYQLAITNIAANVNGLNPTKFFVSDVDKDWGTYFLPRMVAHQLPVFMLGWLADFADPHNFIFPWCHSDGTFAYSQVYGNATVNALIEAGILQPDDTLDYNGEINGPNPIALMDNWHVYTDPASYLADPPDTRWPRRSMYYALQQLYIEDCPSFMLFQAAGRAYQQFWNRGWYDNKLDPGAEWYHRWKKKTHFGDVNNDGAVGGADWSGLSAHWTLPAGPGGYNPRADLTGGTAATTGSDYGLVKGVPDGSVGMADLSIVSAYWDVPEGPSHP